MGPATQPTDDLKAHEKTGTELNLGSPGHDLQQKYDPEKADKMVKAAAPHMEEAIELDKLAVSSERRAKEAEGKLESRSPASLPVADRPADERMVDHSLKKADELHTASGEAARAAGAAAADAGEKFEEEAGYK